ncbi:MAG: neutral ceramidase [Candidatus Marinamargulisbacteria bacterium]|jgi:neutral ceramidase
MISLKKIASPDIFEFPVGFEALSYMMAPSYKSKVKMTGPLFKDAIHPDTPTLKVGADRTDITPPPGYPMGGFAISGKTSMGSLNRLFVRSVYLKDPKGTPLVWCAADLWSIPGGLGDRVNEIVAKKGLPLGRSQLMLAATHTHTSPGNFSTSEMYSTFASPRPGFDGRLFDFLSHRIANSIIGAFKNREPASMTTGCAAVFGLSINRSMPAFMKNPEADAIIEENQARYASFVPEEDRDSLPKECFAVDPSLTTLTFRAIESDRVIALAAFFSVHNTVMGPKSCVYDGDLFGVASRVVELDHEDHPVAALFNGTLGDVSPHYTSQDRTNSLRLGESLGKAILKLAEKRDETRSISPNFRTAYNSFPMRGTTFEHRGEPKKTATFAMMGASQLGGTRDGRTWFYEKGWKEGITANAIPGHGIKPYIFNAKGWRQPAWLVKSLNVLTPPPPDHVPLGTHALDDLYIGMLPGEFTSALGLSLKTDMAALIPDTANILWVGLANEYISYITTDAEYDAQYYEGASTPWGRDTNRLMSNNLMHLFSQITDPKEPCKDFPDNYAYTPGISAKFGDEEFAIELELLTSKMKSCLPDGLDNLADLPHIRWTQNSQWPIPANRSPIPTVKIQQFDLESQHWTPFFLDGRAQNNWGLNFLTLCTQRQNGVESWTCFWLNEPDSRFAEPMRFSVDNAYFETL